MARVVDFGRKRREESELRRRRATVPWLSLAVLVGVAAAMWSAAELRPGITNRNGAAVIDGNGTFALCAGAVRWNCVIDGDTVRYGGVTIRLEDIDAPETHSPRCSAEAALGRQATERLLELMNAGPFALVKDGIDEDRYGRKLRTIERGGRSLGDTLIAEGLARRWDGARRSWCGSQAF